jgi:hypothetical protein
VQERTLSARHLTHSGKYVPEIWIGSEELVRKDSQPLPRVFLRMFPQPRALALTRWAPVTLPDRNPWRCENVDIVTHIAAIRPLAVQLLYPGTGSFNIALLQQSAEPCQVCFQRCLAVNMGLGGR